MKYLLPWEMSFKHNDITITPILESLQLLDISDEEYFGEKYRGYISNSRLKLIDPTEGGSPELFEEGLKFSVSDSFYFGSAIHELVLQPEEFVLVDSVNRPTAKAGFMADELFPTYWVGHYVTDADVIKASNKIEYYKGKMNDQKIRTLTEKCRDYWESRLEYENSRTDTKTPIYLDPNGREKAKSCLRNLKNHKKIQELLHPKGFETKPLIKNEATILLDVLCVTPSKDEIVLQLKGKLDNFTIDFESQTITLNDLKTTGHLVEDFGKESFYKYHYYRQMGMYGWMLNLANSAIYKLDTPTFLCNMLLVSSIPPCYCGVYKVSNSQVQKGIKEFADLLKRVAYFRLYGN